MLLGWRINIVKKQCKDDPNKYSNIAKKICWTPNE